jgi:phosphate transport system ATP-binding protein
LEEETVPEGVPETQPKISVRQLSFFYGTNRALQAIDLDIQPMAVTALIGPSGCGKTTLLRCINRMNDLVENGRIVGQVLIDGRDVYARGVVPEQLRKEVGMVFQKPNPFPTSIFNNIAYGPRIHGVRKRSDLDAIVEDVLKRTGLWDEVRDDLDVSGLSLSGGQQQRLCIARALAVQPEILLMDEPCSALDPIATSRIEDLMFELKRDYTIVLVTHNMQQAQRASDYTAFFVGGSLVEYDTTRNLFLFPASKQTQDYISGRFG